MKLPSSKPLTEAEVDLLNDVISDSDHDDAITCVSELDGFLTAIVSGPNMIQPSRWLPELWEWVSSWARVEKRGGNATLSLSGHAAYEFHCHRLDGKAQALCAYVQHRCSER